MRYAILVALAVALTGVEATRAEENPTGSLKNDHASHPPKAAKSTLPRGNKVAKKPATPINKKKNKEKSLADEEPASVKAWREVDI